MRQRFQRLRHQARHRIVQTAEHILEIVGKSVKNVAHVNAVDLADVTGVQHGAGHMPDDRVVGIFALPAAGMGKNVGCRALNRNFIQQIAEVDLLVVVAFGQHHRPPAHFQRAVIFLFLLKGLRKQVAKPAIFGIFFIQFRQNQNRFVGAAEFNADPGQQILRFKGIRIRLHGAFGIKIGGVEIAAFKINGGGVQHRGIEIAFCFHRLLIKFQRSVKIFFAITQIAHHRKRGRIPRIDFQRPLGGVLSFRVILQFIKNNCQVGGGNIRLFVRLQRLAIICDRFLLLPQPVVAIGDINENVLAFRVFGQNVQKRTKRRRKIPALITGNRLFFRFLQNLPSADIVQMI